LILEYVKKEESSSKYFFISLLIVAIAKSILVIYPFFISIIGGALLGYVFYPIYARITKRIKSKTISAFLTAVILILILSVPIILLINNLTLESQYLYLKSKQQIMGRQLIDSRCYENTFICNSVNRINKLLENQETRQYLINRLNDILQYLTKQVSYLILSLPSIILQLVVALFTTFYVLKDGKSIITRIAEVAPLKVHHQEQIIKQFNDVTKAVIYGSFVVALVQGTLGAFGLWIFGIKSYLLWAIIMTFFALIPFIGTWAVWLPASAYLSITGYLQSEPGLIWRGVGLFFYGLLIISTIDNILKPIIVAEKAKVHPLVILIGILGGIYAFGLIGILLGPLILAMLQTLLEIYERERRPHVHEKESCIIGKKNTYTKILEKFKIK